MCPRASCSDESGMCDLSSSCRIQSQILVLPIIPLTLSLSHSHTHTLFPSLPSFSLALSHTHKHTLFNSLPSPSLSLLYTLVSARDINFARLLHDPPPPTYLYSIRVPLLFARERELVFANLFFFPLSIFFSR